MTDSEKIKLRRKILNILPRSAIERLSARYEPWLANKADLINDISNNWYPNEINGEILKLINKASK